MLNRDLELRVAAANVELHRRLQQVEAARATAEQANIAKSRFFAAASHDLRQPLHSLGLFANALRDVVGNAEGHHLVRRIGDSISALNRLLTSCWTLATRSRHGRGAPTRHAPQRVA
jgi:signal transduction histidine kinase